jgi:hypothetical protein
MPKVSDPVVRGAMIQELPKEGVRVEAKVPRFHEAAPKEEEHHEPAPVNQEVVFLDDGEVWLAGVKVGTISHKEGAPKPWILELPETEEYPALGEAFLYQAEARQRAQELLAGIAQVRAKAVRRRRGHP